ncbi:MAG TPA: hypothetical protein VGC93_19570 [Thermoanaerobaculia bacterium]
MDEIFPFFGWSLFSKVPNLESRYWIVIDRHDGRPVEPPVSFLQAPESIVTGNRWVARKVIQRLGRAVDDGRTEDVEGLRRLLEHNYLKGRVRYELLFERYQPLDKWKTGESRERRRLASFDSGDSNEDQGPR